MVFNNDVCRTFTAMSSRTLLSVLVFIGTGHTVVLLPQHDKFCVSLGNAADYNGSCMCLRWLHKETVEYGWVKLLDNIHLEDQGRGGGMTMGQVLQKFLEREVGGIGLCSCPIAYLV